jgi:hypothetical protein
MRDAATKPGRFTALVRAAVLGPPFTAGGRVDEAAHQSGSPGFSLLSLSPNAAQRLKPKEAP